MCRIPGIVELIEDGVNGLLVDVDSVEDTAKTILRLLVHRAYRDRIALAALETARQNNWEAISTRYLSLCGDE